MTGTGDTGADQINPPPADAWADPWADLRRHTPARIALGRAGTSLPTAELLRFAAAHAQARDAVHIPLDTARLAAHLQAQAWATVSAHSRAPNRASYLRRPDWGRQLDAPSLAVLQATASTLPGPPDLLVVLGDGLSAQAVQQHGASVLAALRAALSPDVTLAPLVIAAQARVALADQIGALLQARLVLILLGERPGLSAPHSLGAYLTHAPQVGCQDAQRNCVSNIRPDGLPPQQAALRLAWLVREALRRRLTGVALKDDSSVPLLPGQAA